MSAASCSPPYADKRNLTLLCDRAFLHEAGPGRDEAEALAAAVARTIFLTSADRDQLWTERRHWFFKSVRGYGSRAAYRGEKLTRRVWDEIGAADYVAQVVVALSERIAAPDDPTAAMKADVRNYAYAGSVLMLTARLYRGQTTNLRTARGRVRTGIY